MDQDLIERFKRLQKEEQEHKERIARLTGKRDQLMAQLKESFGISSLDEAERKLASLQQDVARREKRVAKLVADMENAINV